jgi:hypothetical protein
VVEIVENSPQPSIFQRFRRFESLHGAGRGAPRQAHTVQSGERGRKGMLAPWLVAPPTGLCAYNQDQKTVSLMFLICPWCAGFMGTVDRLCAVRLAEKRKYFTAIRQ